jgi:hypothetical protein
MSKIAKILLILAAAWAVLLLGSGLLLAGTVLHSGLVRVAVDQPDTCFDIAVPAALVHVGLATLPLVLEDEVLADVRADLGDFGPAAAAALRAIEDAPDAVLVEVEDHGEHVRVAKEGRNLEVYVQGADGTVEVTLPAGLLGRIARAIS